MSGSSRPCEEVRNDLGGYVLSGLEPSEEARVSEHLLSCAACRAEYERLRELPGLMATVADTPPGPPPTLRARVLARAGEDTAARHTRRRVLQLVAALVVGAVLGGAGVWLSSTPTGGGTVRVPLTAADGFAAEGVIRLTPSDNGVTVDLALDGLEPLDDDEVYEAWLAPPGGAPLSVGTFRPGPSGTADVTLSAAGPVDRYASVWITLEPDFADPAHDGPTVVAAPLPGAAASGG